MLKIIQGSGVQVRTCCRIFVYLSVEKRILLRLSSVQTMGRRSTNNSRSGTVMSGVNSWRWFRTFLLTAQLRWEWINKRLINFRVRQLLQNIIRLSLNVRHFRIFYFLVKLLKDWNIFFPNTWMFSMISDTLVLLGVSSSCVDDWSSSECVISSSLALVSASDGLLSPTEWISFSSSWLFY